MTISKIFHRDVDVSQPDESVQVAARRMRDRKIGCLVVVDPERKPLGLVTDRDLTTRVLGEGRDPIMTLISDVMSSYPQVLQEYTPIDEALRVMRSLAARRMPVVRSDGVLAGILSVDDIMRVLFGELADVGGLLAKESAHSGVPA